MARPVSRPATPSPTGEVSRSALEYEPSEKIISLSKPVKRKRFSTIDEVPEMELYENPHEVPRDYRNIKSGGTTALATPKKSKARKKYVQDPNAAKLFEISPNALKCKASENTKKLAKPKMDNSDKQKENCFGVKPAALKQLPKKRQVHYERLSTPRNKKEKSA